MPTSATPTMMAKSRHGAPARKYMLTVVAPMMRVVEVLGCMISMAEGMPTMSANPNKP